jgi:MPBQ/MSBQ methyltransferase
MVIATWCQREETAATPLSQKERADLQFLYDEWAHPYFVSVQEYGRLLEVTPLP